MRRQTTITLTLAAALALAGCHGDRGRDGGAADQPAIDGRALGSSPERGSAVTDTTPHRPGQPDTVRAP
jgi:hypothetical protein